MQILLQNVFCVAQYKASEPMTMGVIFKGKNTLRTSLATLWKVLFKENDFLAVYIAKRPLIGLTLDINIVLWMQSEENILLSTTKSSRIQSLCSIITVMIIRASLTQQDLPRYITT